MPSSARVAAGAFGFLILIQVFGGLERYLVRRRRQRLLQLLEQPLVRGIVAEPLLATGGPPYGLGGISPMVSGRREHCPGVCWTMVIRRAAKGPRNNQRVDDDEQQRRPAKRKGKWPVGSVVDVGVGHLGEGNPNCGVAVNCYVCSTPHQAHGLAQIEDKADTIHVPLCEACVQAGDFNAIVRKYWGTPDLEISEGGEATEEQIAALVEGRGARQH